MKDIIYYFIFILLLLLSFECSIWIIDNPLKAISMHYCINIIMYVVCIFAMIEPKTNKG